MLATKMIPWSVRGSLVTAALNLHHDAELFIGKNYKSDKFLIGTDEPVGVLHEIDHEYRPECEISDWRRSVSILDHHMTAVSTLGFQKKGGQNLKETFVVNIVAIVFLAVDRARKCAS